MAAVPAPTPLVPKAEKKQLLELLGYRVEVDLDDSSTLTGRLVSLSASENLVLTDVERRRPLKRQRDSDGALHMRRECYSSVLFVRGASVVAVRYNSGITSDKTVIDTIVRKGGIGSRVINVDGDTNAAK